jgi:membrane-bound inhibitor of C-type lysozyme
LVLWTGEIPNLFILFFHTPFIFSSQSSIIQAQSQPKENKVRYTCAAGKTIAAAFWLGMPGKVRLKLSDGRSYQLPQVMSASGVKYANQGEKFVFWSKGDTAFVLEDDVMTYRDCASR